MTEVDFLPLDDAEIDAYFELVNPFDKAGAYGIQAHGDRIVSGIRGGFDNVMGLPVEMVMAKWIYFLKSAVVDDVYCIFVFECWT